MQPNETETGNLKDHVIIAGYGRVGQLIADLLSERLIPFVAVDVISQRVQVNPFNIRSTLQQFSTSSERLKICLFTLVMLEVNKCFTVSERHVLLVWLPFWIAQVSGLDLLYPFLRTGSNYRCVWTMKRHFPHVKTYVRAFDMDHARNLERAGASVVVPETLEPSLQLAANVLAQVK